VSNSVANFDDEAKHGQSAPIPGSAKLTKPDARRLAVLFVMALKRCKNWHLDYIE